jgi:hypothetical protein
MAGSALLALLCWLCFVGYALQTDPILIAEAIFLAGPALLAGPIFMTGHALLIGPVLAREKRGEHLIC